MSSLDYVNEYQLRSLETVIQGMSEEETYGAISAAYALGFLSENQACELGYKYGIDFANWI